MERSSMELIDGDLKLRPFASADKKRLVELGNNPNVARFLTNTFPHPYQQSDAQEWIDFVQDENPSCNFAIEWRGEFVGGIGLTPMDDVHTGTAGVGYWLGEPYWRKGLAVRALRLITAYAFEELLFIRLQALVYAGNEASARVLEKGGFVREGIMRRHVRKGGKIYDALLYARVKAD